MSNIQNTPKKRGRKPKVKVDGNNLMQNTCQLNNNNETNNNIDFQITENTQLNSINHSNDSIIVEEQSLATDNNNHTSENNNQVVKKRGRKPKGGKIVKQNINFQNINETRPNVILHLKCFIKDLEINSDKSKIDCYSFSTNNGSLNYSSIDFNNKIHNNNFCDINSTNNETIHVNIKENNYVNDNEKSYDNDYYDYDENECCSLGNKFKETKHKELNKKIKLIKYNLHINNVENIKSACFWDTHKFDNPPIYIPKYFTDDTYHVYGCFCSPECAVAYLMNENIDSSVKFERLQLLNNIYSKMYEYNKSIRPAPNPYYLLDKYYGNMTIQEYRSLLSSERLFLISDKPLTRIMPELHEDNDDFIVNNKLIQHNNIKADKKSKMSKTNILSEHFGLM